MAMLLCMTKGSALFTCEHAVLCEKRASKAANDEVCLLFRLSIKVNEGGYFDNSCSLFLCLVRGDDNVLFLEGKFAFENELMMS